MTAKQFSRRTNWQLQVNAFTQVQREVTESERAVLDLTLSNPTRAGLAYDSKAIFESLTNTGALDYDAQPKGLLRARSAAADYYRLRTESVDLDPEAIVLTTSTSEGYSYVMRLLTDPGDEILVPRPSY